MVGPDTIAAFGLGADDRHTASLDTGGIALAAIQALARKVDELTARLEALEQPVR